MISAFAVFQSLGTVPLTTAGLGAAVGAAGVAVRYCAAIALRVIEYLLAVAAKAAADGSLTAVTKTAALVCLFYFWYCRS